MKPVKTTTWEDFTISDIKVATTRMKLAYIRPQESLAEKHRVNADAITRSLRLFAY